MKNIPTANYVLASSKEEALILIEKFILSSSIFSSKNSDLVGTVLLNNAVLKGSFTNYEAEKKLGCFDR